jgi:hypothetical protein
VYAFYDNYECDTQTPAANAQGRGSNPGGSAAKCAIKGNEVYRSNDKGATWKKVSGQNDDDAQKAFMKGMSNTYAWVFGNIRVDPTDENTIYTLVKCFASPRDGGKTFAALHGSARRLLAPPRLEPRRQAPAQGAAVRARRHHAMWIDPEAEQTPFMGERQ